MVRGSGCWPQHWRGHCNPPRAAVAFKIRQNLFCTLMMHRKKSYWLNTASQYLCCTSNNSSYRRIFPVHPLTQRLCPGDAAQEQRCSLTARAAEDDPGEHLERARLCQAGPARSWHGLSLPTWGSAPHHPDRSRRHSSEGHRLPDAFLHWRGWLGGCLALCSAVRKIPSWRTSSGLGPSFPGYWPKLSSASAS